MSITKVEDIRRRSVVDPVSGCWHWQGAKSPTDGVPRIWAFDHERGDKRTMCGPKAVWNIAHGCAPRPGWLVFRRCVTTDCVNPVHMDQAPDKARIGLHIRRNGARKGEQTEAQKANVKRMWEVAGVKPTPEDVVMAIRAADRNVTNIQLAEMYGIAHQTVSRIRRGDSHRHLIGPALMFRQETA